MMTMSRDARLTPLAALCDTMWVVISCTPLFCRTCRLWRAASACRPAAACFGWAADRCSLDSRRVVRRFLNDALQVLWPAFDRALGALLKAEIEPLLRASSPAAVDGASFEAFSFGATPMQVRGF